MFGPFGGNFFSPVSVFILVAFVLVVGITAFRVGKGLKEWNDNNNSPIEKETVKVVSKRAEVYNRSGMDNNNVSTSSSSTTYYVTFQNSNGDRMELKVSGTDYGLLVEGDEGTLTYQGTRYKDFERIK